MRLALLHYTKPPIVGGVEHVVGEQGRAMEHLGHSVRIYSAAEKGQFRKDLEGDNYDAVIVHNVFTMPFDLEWTRELTELAQARRDVCWVNWVHDVAAINPAYAETGWNERVPLAIHVAVSSVRAEEWRSVAKLGERDVKVIPNGVDAVSRLGLTARIERLADVRKLWGSDLNLLQPVRLVRRKNVELGIDLMADLRDQGLNVRLIVTGAPDPHQGDGLRYFEQLQALVKKRGVQEQVVFGGIEGTLSEDDLRSLYVLCDGLFFPSWSEGFGLPLLEASLHRLPVWCSDLEVHREVVKSEAFWFDPRSGAVELGTRLAKWCQTEAGLLARRRVWSEYSWRTLCKERLVPLLHAAI